MSIWDEVYEPVANDRDDGEAIRIREAEVQEWILLGRQQTTRKWRNAPGETAESLAAYLREVLSENGQAEWLKGRKYRRSRKRLRDSELAGDTMDGLLPGWREKLFSDDDQDRAEVTRLFFFMHRPRRRIPVGMAHPVGFTEGTLAEASGLARSEVLEIVNDPIIAVSPSGSSIEIAPGVRRLEKDVPRVPVWPRPAHHGTAYVYVKLKCRCERCREWQREARKRQRDSREQW
jgi:hypothetical protein